MSNMIVQDFEVIYDTLDKNYDVSIIIPLYNYENHIIDTIESAFNQTYQDLCIIVLDDCSTDTSLATVQYWMNNQIKSEIGLFLAKNKINSKLSVTRNTGISISSSQYCFMLDADNILYPRCIEKHVQALSNNSKAASAYGLIEVFEGKSDIMGAGVFDKENLKYGNYIDAMAMFRRGRLLDIGGYEHIPYGWEDYDLWLRMAEAGEFAVHIPEVLSRYRQHNSSMLRTETNISKNIGRLHAIMKERHPWLEIS